MTHDSKCHKGLVLTANVIMWSMIIIITYVISSFIGKRVWNVINDMEYPNSTQTPPIYVNYTNITDLTTTYIVIPMYGFFTIFVIVISVGSVMAALYLLYLRKIRTQQVITTTQIMEIDISVDSSESLSSSETTDK
jgi:ABC-type multidrug transport system fused ATPase/permease subunit